MRRLCSLVPPLAQALGPAGGLDLADWCDVRKPKRREHLHASTTTTKQQPPTRIRTGADDNDARVYHKPSLVTFFAHNGSISHTPAAPRQGHSVDWLAPGSISTSVSVAVDGIWTPSRWLMHGSRQSEKPSALHVRSESSQRPRRSIGRRER